MKQTPFKSTENQDRSSLDSTPVLQFSNHEEFIENKRKTIYENLQNFFRKKETQPDPLNPSRFGLKNKEGSVHKFKKENLENTTVEKNMTYFKYQEYLDSKSKERMPKRAYLSNSFQFFQKPSISPFQTPLKTEPDICRRSENNSSKINESRELTAEVYIPSSNSNSERSVEQNRFDPFGSVIKDIEDQRTIKKKNGLQIAIVNPNKRKESNFNKTTIKANVGIQTNPNLVNSEVQVSKKYEDKSIFCSFACSNKETQTMQSKPNEMEIEINRDSTINYETLNVDSKIIVEVDKPTNFRKVNPKKSLPGLYPPIIIELVRKTFYAFPSIQKKRTSARSKIICKSKYLIKNNKCKENYIQEQLAHLQGYQVKYLANKPIRQICGGYKLRKQKRVKYYNFAGHNEGKKIELQNLPLKFKKKIPQIQKKITKKSINSCFKSISSTLKNLNSNQEGLEHSLKEYDDEAIMKRDYLGLPSPLQPLNVNAKKREKALEGLKRDFSNFMNTSYIYQIHPKSKSNLQLQIAQARQSQQRIN